LIPEIQQIQAVFDIFCGLTGSFDHMIVDHMIEDHLINLPA